MGTQSLFPSNSCIEALVANLFGDPALEVLIDNPTNRVYQRRTTIGPDGVAHTVENDNGKITRSSYPSFEALAKRSVSNNNRLPANIVGGTALPKTNIGIDADKNFIIEIQTVGMDKDRITMVFDDDVLSIKVAPEKTDEASTTVWLQHGIPEASEGYERHIFIDPKKWDATSKKVKVEEGTGAKNGKLIITIPKNENVKDKVVLFGKETD